MEIDGWHILVGAAGLISAMTGYTWLAEVEHRKAHASRLLEHGDRITRLEAHMLTREQLKAELQDVEKRIMDAITGMDRHHTAAIARVEAMAMAVDAKAEQLRRDISGA